MKKAQGRFTQAWGSRGGPEVRGHHWLCVTRSAWEVHSLLSLGLGLLGLGNFRDRSTPVYRVSWAVFPIKACLTDLQTPQLRLYGPPSWARPLYTQPFIQTEVLRPYNWGAAQLLLSPCLSSLIWCLQCSVSVVKSVILF